jgi:hypothetical protein
MISLDRVSEKSPSDRLRFTELPINKYSIISQKYPLINYFTRIIGRITLPLCPRYTLVTTAVTTAVRHAAARPNRQ